MTERRYTVRTDVPRSLIACGFVAYVHDARHPDMPQEGGAISWHVAMSDAHRVAISLNRLDSGATTPPRPAVQRLMMGDQRARDRKAGFNL